ncbi:MAG: lipoyl synthase, partial [Dehalococcoidia bacterium]|nr:lipoyl synthase [Dehalococcoidia bacterium]
MAKKPTDARQEQAVPHHPPWIRVRLAQGPNYREVKGLLAGLGLHTVCQEAHCPNIGECFESRTATFLILGPVCTRNCRFCAVEGGHPLPLDLQEPQRVAEAVLALGLRYVVVTSVTRDDLPDGGADQFAQTIRAIRRERPDCGIEVLIPDFRGSALALEMALEARPDVLNHNVETVSRLYPLVRPQADYARSLTLLKRAKEAGRCFTKSGLMVGVGETWDEVLEAMADLREAGCDLLTIGQYLRPSPQHLPIVRYYAPEEFGRLAEEGRALGFRHVESGPLVRSSYHA